MWIRVKRDKNDIQRQDGYVYIDGKNTQEYYFNEKTAKELEEDGFLKEMWEQFDALFDWGDCDFFEPERCKRLIPWLRDRLTRRLESDVEKFYRTLLSFAEIAVKYGTGIDFDF